MYEKNKNTGKSEPVTKNGKPQYHIGHGPLLPISKDESRILINSGSVSPKQAQILMNENSTLKDLKGIKISEDDADLLGKFRYKDHVAGVESDNPGIEFSTLDPMIRRVVYDMAYNLGPNFMNQKVRGNRAFKDFKAALKSGDIEKMIEEIKDSLYFTEQLPGRATKNINILKKLP